MQQRTTTNDDLEVVDDVTATSINDVTDDPESERNDTLEADSKNSADELDDELEALQIRTLLPQKVLLT